MRNLALSSLLLLVSALGAEGAARAQHAAPGAWRAWLDSPGGPVPFRLELAAQGETLTAQLVSAGERTELTLSHPAPNALKLEMPWYDAWLEGTVAADGKSIDGAWKKRRGPDTWATLPFHARHGDGALFAPEPPGSATTPEKPLARLWSVAFEKHPDPALGMFVAGPAGSVSGTFATTTGDYRFLEGTFEHGRLRLACFDGAHAFLFDARLDAEGGLKGDFWSGDAWHETWTARADANARPPNSFDRAVLSSRAKIGELAFADIDGNPFYLSDPMLWGRASVIVLFGTWCPNCHDEAEFLVELDKKYRKQGLRILGLAFEVGGDPARDAEQVRRFIERHHVEYPVLLAGRPDSETAAAAFPALERIDAWPTTLFRMPDGEVFSIHSGWAGPATGDARTDLERQITVLVESALGRPTPANEVWEQLASSPWIGMTSDYGCKVIFERTADGTLQGRRRVFQLAEVDGKQQMLSGDETLEQVWFTTEAVRVGSDLWRMDWEAGALVSAEAARLRLTREHVGTTPYLEAWKLLDAAGLEKALASPQPLARREALAAITFDDDPSVRALSPKIVELLADPDYTVRATACWAAAELELPDAVPGLLANLAHVNPWVRREAADALHAVYSDDPAVAERLSQLGSDPDPFVREVALAPR